MVRVERYSQLVDMVGTESVVRFKFFVSRFHYKSHIFQLVPLQKVIFFLANKLIIFNYFLINISK